jgi:hypothetical protein
MGRSREVLVGESSGGRSAPTPRTRCANNDVKTHRELVEAAGHITLPKPIRNCSITNRLVERFRAKPISAVGALR